MVIVSVQQQLWPFRKPRACISAAGAVKHKTSRDVCHWIRTNVGHIDSFFILTSEGEVCARCRASPKARRVVNQNQNTSFISWLNLQMTLIHHMDSARFSCRGANWSAKFIYLHDTEGNIISAEKDSPATLCDV